MSEFKVIARHAGTVLVGQLATMAYGITDTIVTGRYSQEALAALSVGTAVYITVFVALNGVLQSLLPIWAELHGAGHTHKLGHSFRQALYLCLVLSLLGMGVLLHPDPLLNWADVPNTLRLDVQHYLQVLAWTLPMALIFRLYGTLNQSLGKPKLVTWVQIASLLFKVPLSILLAFGGWGLPALGATGCAVATLIVQVMMATLALWLLRTQALYTPYALWQWPGRPDRAVLREFIRLGLPSGLTILVEVTSFTLMAIFIARLGTAPAAGHQIAANLASVLYMMPLAIGIATSARTSYWLGAQQSAKARHAVRIGFVMVLSGALVLATLVFTLRHTIAQLYTHDPEVITLASTLLMGTALYHLFDGLQALAIFVLRCFRLTVLPFVIYSILLWGLGFNGGYWLTYEGLGPWPAQRDPMAFWLCSAAALALAALTFWVMIISVLRRDNRKPS
jgi:MATE family multidrug resistance protein